MQWATDAPAGPARILSAFRLRSDHAGFGGLSGTWMSPDGRALTLISDRGSFFELRLTRDAAGAIAGVELARHGRMAGADGRPVRRADADPEELSRTELGFLVSFEQSHRIALYRNGLDRAPEPFRLPLEARKLPPNAGIEAMAVLADGRIVLISEPVRDADGTVAVWSGRPGAWRPCAYRPRPGYRPTGAAALPDGSILVTERRFSLLGGFAGLLVRAVPPPEEGGVWRRTELLDLAMPPLAENFEAVAVWRDEGGTMRAYMVSDDNFNGFQASLLVEVALPGNPP